VYCSNERYITLFDAKMEMLWYFPPSQGQYFASSPVVDLDGNVYLGSDHGTLYSISKSGNLNWEHSNRNNPTINPTIASALGRNGVLYAARDNVLYAFSAVDGSSLWSLKFPQYYLVGTPIIGNDGTVFIPHVSPVSSSLYAVSPQGVILWKVDTPTVAPFGQPVIAADGEIYVYNSIGQVFVFS
jgi:outer membrane protein assembly factor BamB